MQKLIIRSSYLRLAQKPIPEFWTVDRIEYIRYASANALPPRVMEEGPSRYGRLLDRMVFRDLRPREVNEMLKLGEALDKLEVDVGLDFGEVRLSVPVYVGDMSFGALSGRPNIAIARAVTEVGAVAGVGEGGLHPEVAKYKNIVIQWASARFGVDVDMLRRGVAVTIKIGQGAKPGIGGHLPGSKVTEEIARLRRIPVGVDAISPAPHHDIYSIEDLAQRVKALRLITGKPVFVKVAATNNVHFVAVGVARSTAAGVIIDGAGAGTGATPRVVRDHLGIPIDFAVPVADRFLRRNGVRDGFIVIAGGMIYSVEDVAKLAALGADMVNIGTAALLSMGCIMCHSCNTGTCPTALTNRLDDLKVLDVDWAAKMLTNYLVALRRGLKALLYSLGMSSLRELVGRRDLLVINHVDERVSEVIGVELGQHSETAWYGERPVLVPKEVYEEGKTPVTGMGGVVYGFTTPARRPLDLLRIDAAQVTHPAVDPYREEVETWVRLGGELFEAPLVVPLDDPAARRAAHALGLAVLDELEGAVVSPDEAVSVDVGKLADSGVIVIDERMGGKVAAEEAVALLDVKLRREKIRSKVDIVVVGDFVDGGDVFKLVALGADSVAPTAFFDQVGRSVSKYGELDRRFRYENAVLELIDELKLIMGACGVTNAYHMVGNRELLRALDGSVARRLGVKIFGE